MNSLNNKNVLATGGAGFIGSHLVDRIIQENPKAIHVVDNFFLGEEENLNDAVALRPDLEIFRLDASDLAAMRDLVDEKQIGELVGAKHAFAMSSCTTALQLALHALELEPGTEALVADFTFPAASDNMIAR
jgi:nucleoside-diphosphate-sugar epimerase